MYVEAKHATAHSRSIGRETHVSGLRRVSICPVCIGKFPGIDRGGKWHGRDTAKALTCTHVLGHHRARAPGLSAALGWGSNLLAVHLGHGFLLDALGQHHFIIITSEDGGVSTVAHLCCFEASIDRCSTRCCLHFHTGRLGVPLPRLLTVLVDLISSCRCCLDVFLLHVFCPHFALCRTMQEISHFAGTNSNELSVQNCGATAG